MRADSGAILITGATGFIGSNLAARLLAVERAPLLCLVRGGGNFRARLANAVLGAARAAGDLERVEPELERLIAVPGDLGEGGLGLSEEARRQLQEARVQEVWHCAASLRFEDHHREELLRDNVAGTGRMVALALELGATAFHHLSTAYVAGTCRGRIPETRYQPEAPCNNRYEESKRLAEDRALAGAASGRMAVKIFRPSIVIGHSRTLEATSEMGFYGFLAGLLTFAEQVEDKVPGYLARQPLRLLTEPGTTLDLIPVDLLVDEALALARDPEEKGTFFHLTNPFPVDLGEARRAAVTVLGRYHPLRLEEVGDEGALRPLDHLFHRQLRFYAPYLMNDKRFERRRDGSRPPQNLRIGAAQLEGFAEKFLDRHQAQRRARARRRAQALAGLEPVAVRCRRGEPLTYHRGGGGPAVVLVNAYGASLGFWEHVVDGLVSRHRVLTWECRGCSVNGADRPYSLVEHAEDLKEILDREGVSRAHLVAWCTGPKVALELQARHPEVVASMTFVTPSLAPLDGEELATRYDQVLGKVARMVCRRPEMADVFLRALAGVLTDAPPGSGESDAEVADLLGLIGQRFRGMVIGPFLNERVIAHYARMIVEYQEHPVGHLLASARAPALLIGAENDRIAHPRSPEAAAARMPRARSLVLAGASHWCLMENGEEIVQEISSFLERVEQ